MFIKQAQTADAPQASDFGAEQAPEGGVTSNVEIVFEEHAGGEQLAIKYLTWTDGLGWCCQKTIKIDADRLDELHRAVAVARQRVSRRRAQTGQTAQAGQVIHLPTLA